MGKQNKLGERLNTSDDEPISCREELLGNRKRTEVPSCPYTGQVFDFFEGKLTPDESEVNMILEHIASGCARCCLAFELAVDPDALIKEMATYVYNMEFLDEDE